MEVMGMKNLSDQKNRYSWPYHQKYWTVAKKVLSNNCFEDR